MLQLRRIGLSLLLVSLGVAIFSTVSADANTGADKPDAEQDEDAIKFTSPELAVLDMLVGPWRLTETHFNEAGEVIATFKGGEEITWILDRHALRRKYARETSKKETYEAIGTITYNATLAKYHGIWFDNASTTGPNTTLGEFNAETRTFIYTMTSLDTDGSTRRYKVIERFEDAEHREATTYELRGEEVIKLLSVKYRRTVPCPGRIRRVFGPGVG